MKASSRDSVKVRELERTRAAWDAIAAGYDEFVTSSRDWALPLKILRRVGVSPGMRFLDVASGSGALSIPAARLGAEVLAADISPAMVERLKARAREEGLSNLRSVVMDGHALELEDDSFDLAGSQFGVMLFPDLPRGLAEMARVTEPGGRVLMVAYGPPAEVGFLGLFIDAMRSVVPGFTGLPMDPPPLPFQVADPQKLREEMTAAGLQAVRVEQDSEDLEFRSGREAWDWVTNSNPIAVEMIADLTEEQRSEVRGALDGLLRERSGGPGPTVVRNRVHIAIGTK